MAATTGETACTAATASLRANSTLREPNALRPLDGISSSSSGFATPFWVTKAAKSCSGVKAAAPTRSPVRSSSLWAMIPPPPRPCELNSSMRVRLT